mgnify:CR=1 FL=1
MLKLLVEFSLRFRGAVIALACIATAYGVLVTLRSKLDVFPEFAPPQVIIHTEAPGLSPEEVESLVTRPVENGVSGAGDIESIRSQSIQGLSVVTAIFREGTDIMRARQTVSERLVEITDELPDGVRAPVLDPLTSSTSLVLALGLTSSERSPMELRAMADLPSREVLLGHISLGSFVAFNAYMGQLTWPMIALGWVVNLAQRGIASLGRHQYR